MAVGFEMLCTNPESTSRCGSMLSDRNTPHLRWIIWRRKHAFRQNTSAMNELKSYLDLPAYTTPFLLEALSLALQVFERKETIFFDGLFWWWLFSQSKNTYTKKPEHRTTRTASTSWSARLLLDKRHLTSATWPADHLTSCLTGDCQLDKLTTCSTSLD